MSCQDDTVACGLLCRRCQQTYGLDELLYYCPECAYPLEVYYDVPSVAKSRFRHSGGLDVWRYLSLIPVVDESHVVSLGEGGTPLVMSRYLGRQIGVKNLYFKDETRNPTGTFKDRGTTVGVSFALQRRLAGVGCVSTGNMAMSVAAYAARAGMPAVVLVPGDTPSGKLSPLLAYGARVMVIDRPYPEIFRFGLELARHLRYLWLHSDSPLRIEGQKTCAWEIWEQLGRVVPDKVVVPTSSGGNISAIWKGFMELKLMGLADRLPQMVAVQASGCAPIATAFVGGKDRVTPLGKGVTVAHSIANPDPPSGTRALSLIKESGGIALTVSDRQMLLARRMMAEREGMLVEVASAAGPASLRSMVRSGFIKEGDIVVCVITGSGLKDSSGSASRRIKPLHLDSLDDCIRVMEKEIRIRRY